MSGVLARISGQLEACSAPACAAKREARLSPQEMRVARLLAEGHSNRVIARRLSLSENTVKAHLRVIYRKLGVATRAGAAVAVVRQSSGTGSATAPGTGLRLRAEERDGSAS
ncbi:response regulator transcription factor [Kitasatospora putterlickiae]